MTGESSRNAEVERIRGILWTRFPGAVTRQIHEAAAEIVRPAPAESSRDATEVFRQALIDSCGERHYDYDYPERYAGSILAVLDRAGLTVARRPTETPGIREQIEALRLDEPITDADDAAWNRALDAVMELLGGSTETPSERERDA